MFTIERIAQTWRSIPKKIKINLAVLTLLVLVIPISINAALNQVRIAPRAYVATPPTPPIPPSPAPTSSPRPPSPSPKPSPQPTLNLTIPNGGEVWTRGNSYNISWNQIQPSDSTSLHIYTRNANSGTDTYIGAIAYYVSHVAGVNNYLWKIPPSGGPESTPPDGNNIIVEVITRDAKGSVITSDKSNSPFTIKTATTPTPTPSSKPTPTPTPSSKPTPTPTPKPTNNPPLIITTKLNNARVNRNYSNLISGIDLDRNDSLIMIANNLPQGINLTSCNQITIPWAKYIYCFLRGKATELGTSPVTITLQDSQGVWDQKKLLLIVRK